MGRAVIGHTGFVGGNVARQFACDAFYNSRNINDIRGQHFDTIFCAGAPGVKWKANQEPDADRDAIERLTAALSDVICRQMVVFSTVDVYPVPIGVDEHTVIDAERLAPYGRHRLALEEFLRSRFETVVIRLPGLFGPGLRKNIIFDLLHGKPVAGMNPASTFQFYDLANLARDVPIAIGLGAPVVNVATEPVSVSDVARDGFGITFTNPDPPPPVAYDMRTVFADAFGGTGGYAYSRSATLEGIARFATAERGSQP